MNQISSEGKEIRKDSRTGPSDHDFANRGQSSGNGPAFPLAERNRKTPVWTYEEPYEAVAGIKQHLAFYPSRVEALEVIL
jgi:hypothetical protein